MINLNRPILNITFPGSITSLMCLIAIVTNVSAQIPALSESDSVVRTEHVRWVSEFPSDTNRKKSGIISRLGEIIFGPPPVAIAKPMAISANSPDSYYVLDQKTVSLTHISKNKGKTLNPKSKLSNPAGSLVDFCEWPGKGFLITDSKANTIYLISEDGKRIRLLNNSLSLNQPTGIAFIASKNEIWVLETKSHCIAVLDMKGEKVKEYGKRGTGRAEFNYPTHIWADGKGQVYITDSMNHRIQIFNEEGELIDYFGEAGDATGYFARPKGVATDSFGNIYVADALFHTIQIFNNKGEFLYNFGANGRNKGDFWMPTGIYIDKENFIYIADSFNSRVQIFQLINTR